MQSELICRLLDAAYQQPELGNQADPVAEIIYILLSTMTTEANYQRTFASLRAALPTWGEVHAASAEQIQALISDGGLGTTKARLIKELLIRLMRDWDSFDLGFMHTWPTSEIRRYLTTLPGIGYKAATCVVAYSFGRDVCPVDTHTYRVAVRLGLLAPDLSELGRRVHLTIDQVLPPGQRLAFHINAIAHGRQRCHLLRPDCASCPVLDHCVLPEQGRYSRRIARETAAQDNGGEHRTER